MSETIHWVDWSAPAFAQAAAGNQPILLSLVTAWSEECAAMDRTTFSHPEVVAVLSTQFVTIRVDADRRPDVNERYNLGGWPTTVFLTSEGHVLGGGTYLDHDQLLALCARVSDAWRREAADIRARAAERHARDVPRRETPDLTAVDHLRSLMIDHFDATNGGFGSAPKLPHTAALTLALSLVSEEEGVADPELAGIVELTLDRMSALWDPTGGGFHRYADGADWSRPGTEKTLEDNAALLHLLIDAAVLRGSETCRERAGELVRWVKAALADEVDGGFYNAMAGADVDRTIYVDRNADMIAAFLRAAALFEDPWLRDFALKSLETVVLPGYAPGAGVAHSINKDVAGLLTDQIRVASAVIWAHAVTEQLPYSMLAAELVQFAIRTMWDEESQSFRDRGSAGAPPELGLLREPLRPFQLNCEAACVLDRLATLTGDQTYRDRALAVLGSLASEYRQHELFGAPYALAVREVIGRRSPPGLALAKVDWHLETDA